MIAAAHFPGENIVVVLVFVAVMGAGIWGSLRQKRTDRLRSLEIQELADRLKFDDFNPKHDEGFAMGWGFLSRLAQGENRYAFNILRGTYHDQTLFVFDYHYQISSGKSTTDCNLTMLMLVFKAAFPQITIEPGGESFLSKMETVVFGDEDKIRFESVEFSRAYHVRSKDKKFAYDVCNPQLMEYLLANPGLQIEIQGPIISLAFEPQLPVEQIESNLQRLIEICSRLPQYLLTNP
jgi:hypothetical protein